MTTTTTTKPISPDALAKAAREGKLAELLDEPRLASADTLRAARRSGEFASGPWSRAEGRELLGNDSLAGFDAEHAASLRAVYEGERSDDEVLGFVLGRLEQKLLHEAYRPSDEQREEARAARAAADALYRDQRESELPPGALAELLIRVHGSDACPGCGESIRGHGNPVGVWDWRCRICGHTMHGWEPYTREREAAG